MKYISTRGHVGGEQFCDILLGGLAPDGGLYLPEAYPQISKAELASWRHLSYAELAFAIFSKFATDILPADLAPPSTKGRPCIPPYRPAICAAAQYYFMAYQKSSSVKTLPSKGLKPM